MNDMLRSHVLLNEWGDVIARQLAAELKLPTDKAAALGMNIANALADEFAGQQIYVPAFHLDKVNAKHRLIYDEYRSRGDIRALSRKHGIAERSLYRILASVGAADIASRQAQLFTDDNEGHEK